MADKIQLRRDTSSNWTSVNPILSSGEIGIDTTLKCFKIGDGITHWNSLAFNFNKSQADLLYAPINTTSPLSNILTSNIGRIPFSNGSNLIDDSLLVWDNTNKRLGLGIASPSARLHLLSTTEQLRLGYDASNYASFTVSSAGLLSIQTSNNKIVYGASRTPASSTDTGVAGEICWDSTSIYVCIATNTWRVAPLSGFTALRGIVQRVNSISTNTTLDATYDMVTVTQAGVVVTLPTAVNNSGRMYTIDNASTGNITLNTTSSQTIQGQTTQTIPSDCALLCISNGSNWRII